MEKVCLTTIVKEGDQWFSRWLECARALTYPAVTISLITDHDEKAIDLESLDNVVVAKAEAIWRPRNAKSSIYRLVSLRESQRRYFINEMDEDWMLIIDADLWFPPDTIERLLAFGKDVVCSQIVGGIRLMRRKAVGCFHFGTATCPDDDSIYIEETAHIDWQLDVINQWYNRYHGEEYLTKERFACDWMRHKDYEMGEYFGKDNPISH